MNGPPPDPIPLQPDGWCEPCRKKLLHTRKRAERVARIQHLRLYRCPIGEGYHLGHRPNTEDALPARYPHTERLFTGSIQEMRRLAAKLRGADPTSP